MCNINKNTKVASAKLTISTHGAIRLEDLLGAMSDALYHGICYYRDEYGDEYYDEYYAPTEIKIFPDNGEGGGIEIVRHDGITKNVGHSTKQQA